MQSNKAPLISVVVCTYNRVELLTGAMQTLCAQTLDSSYYETIVVDNNSVDNTRDVISEFCRLHSNVRYCLEKQQGLSHARNRGWREAQGEYVGYIDDDCRVPVEWLAVAKNIIKSISPAVFGGPFYPFYNSSKPPWYKDSYGLHKPFKDARILKGTESLNIYGGNMFFLRTLLRKMGGFDAKRGMSGNKIAYSEETVLLRAISEAMPNERIYYDPKLYLYHLVQPSKMTIRYNLRSFFAHGRSSYYYSNANRLQESRSLSNKNLNLVKAFLRTLRALTVDLVTMSRRDREKYPFLKNWLYERSFGHLYTLGVLYEKFTHTE